MSVYYRRVLYEELELRDQMFSEFREKREREIAELAAIKSDLELRLQRAGEEGDQGDTPGGHLVGKTAGLFLMRVKIRGRCCIHKPGYTSHHLSVMCLE